MPDTQLSLGVSASTVLDSNGNGTVTVGPSMPTERWEVYSVVVNVPNPSMVPTATVYNGPAGSSNQIAFTYDGSGDTAAGDVVRLGTGQFLSVVWNGGDSGAVATVSVSGNRFLRGQRAY